jgi:hypothetical protein
MLDEGGTRFAGWPMSDGGPVRQGEISLEAVRRWVVVAIVAVLPVAMVVLGPPLNRSAGLVSTILAVVACFGATARRDPLGFASIGVLPVLLGLASAILGGVRNGIAPVLLALGWILVFRMGGNAIWAWWTKHVLRRPLPSPQREFEIPFSEAVRAYMAWTGDLPQDAPPSEASRVGAAGAREALTAIPAPDDGWRQLRDDWAALMADGLSWFDETPTVDARRRQVEEMWRLTDRQRVLRGREPEWRGLYPTLPEREVEPGPRR